MGYTGELALPVLVFLVLLSRLLVRPINLVVGGPSAAGNDGQHGERPRGGDSYSRSALREWPRIGLASSRSEHAVTSRTSSSGRVR